MSALVHFTRRYSFSASHRLHALGMSDEQNAHVFGKCNNRYGHGHNYFVEITVAGPVNAHTGFVVDMGQLDALAKREIVDRFDETHLNADAAFAGTSVPSTENLAYELERVLQAEVPRLDATGRLRLARVRIEETGNNSFELLCQPPQHPADTAPVPVEPTVS